MRALCDDGVGSALIGVSFALSLVVLVVVGDTAGENSIPLLSDSPLIQYEPGHKPGGLQQEDAGQTYRGVDTERLEPRHVREVSHPEGEDVSDAGDGDGDPGVSHGL